MKLTMSAIRKASLAVGSPFFSRDTMKYYGDTLNSFRVITLPSGSPGFERVKATRLWRGLAPASGVGTRYKFHPETGAITCVRVA